MGPGGARGRESWGTIHQSYMYRPLGLRCAAAGEGGHCTTWPSPSSLTPYSAAHGALPALALLPLLLPLGRRSLKLSRSLLEGRTADFAFLRVGLVRLAVCTNTVSLFLVPPSRFLFSSFSSLFLVWWQVCGSCHHCRSQHSAGEIKTIFHAVNS